MEILPSSLQPEPEILHATVVLQAEQSDDPGIGLVGGVAVDYDRVGHILQGNRVRRVAIKAGAANKKIAERKDSEKRDMLGLIAHESKSTIARSNVGTLEFYEASDGKSLRYRMKLDLLDPEALSAHRKVANGNYNAASIGFSILKSKKEEMQDNSPDGEGVIEVEYASEIEVHEVSILAHGAFGGATVELAARELSGVSDDSFRSFARELITAERAEDEEIEINFAERKVVRRSNYRTRINETTEVTDDEYGDYSVETAEKHSSATEETITYHDRDNTATAEKGESGEAVEAEETSKPEETTEAGEEISDEAAANGSKPIDGLTAGELDDWFAGEMDSLRDMGILN